MGGKLSQKYYDEQVGKQYNRLTLLSQGEDYVTPSTGWKVPRFLCRCICGNEILAQLSSVKNGYTKSCGCLTLETLTKHGHFGKRIYTTWRNMLYRCDPVNAELFPTYRDKDIKVCDRWKENIDNFIEDMGECPKGYEIDRIDTYGDYCKENCRWVDEQLQASNRARMKNNTSGHTGIYWRKDSLKWRVLLVIDGVIHSGGNYKVFEDAVAARKSLELRLLGYNKEYM